MIDLFCGYKGASAAMTDRGWDVVTVDCVRAFNPTFVADVSHWTWQGETPDLIWASPPCPEFSRMSMPWTRAKMPGPPSMILVNAAKRIIEECKPRWWVIENVRGAVPYLGKPAKRIGAYFLWGQFPDFEAQTSKRKEMLPGWQKQHRAMVPYSISKALAIACEQAIGTMNQLGRK